EPGVKAARHDVARARQQIGQIALGEASRFLDAGRPRGRPPGAVGGRGAAAFQHGGSPAGAGAADERRPATKYSFSYIIGGRAQREIACSPTGSRESGSTPSARRSHAAPSRRV